MKKSDEEEKRYLIQDDTSFLDLTKEEREQMDKEYEKHPMVFGSEYDIKNFLKKRMKNVKKLSGVVLWKEVK